MKKLFNKHILIAFILLSTGWIACDDKDEDGGDGGPLSVNAVSPTEGAGGEVVGIKGDGLKNIASVRFDNQDVPASVNPAFITNNSLLLRVPDTAFGGLQNIIFTSKDGSTSQIPFSVVALPNIATVDKNEFSEDYIINFTGNNFDDVSSVKLVATNQEAEILEQTRKTISVKMPETTVDYTKLLFTNVSGTRETVNEFAYLPNHNLLFGDDFTGVDNWSWGGDYVQSSDRKVSGDYSLKMDMKEAWVGLQLATDSRPNIDLASYRFISFYVYGHSKDVNLIIKFNWSDFQTITVIANRWNYFKLPLQPFTTSVGSVNNIVMQNADVGVFYLDNLVLLK